MLHDFFGYRSGSSSGQLGERTVEQLTKASAVKRFLAAEHEAVGVNSVAEMLRHMVEVKV